MAKVRIYQWAKQNKLESATVVKELSRLGYKVRNHTSLIEEEILVKELKKTNTSTSESNKKASKSKINKSEVNTKSSKNQSRSTAPSKKTQTDSNKDGKRTFNRDTKKPQPKKEETAVEEKPKTKQKTTKRPKRKAYDRFEIFDKEDNKNLDNGKTKTQIKKEAREKRQEEISKETTTLKWQDDMTVAKFAQEIKIPVTDIVSKLFELGIMATVNQNVSQEVGEILASEYNVEVIENSDNDQYDMDNLLPEFKEEDKEARPPVVTIMGHVDHGKTTLLDTLRNLNKGVVDTEAGGITQHIGAYQIKTEAGDKITFLDTPGHAAFSQMRARGANITDIIILVVSADDGVMPQTIEAITHAKTAKIPIIVAINKIDKPDANPERVLGELAEQGIMVEEWGGEVPAVRISALKKEGIDGLLDYIKVMSDIYDYKASPKGYGVGTVIESNLDKGRGAVATILLEEGELKLKDPIVIGNTWGSVRTLEDEYGVKHKKILPSMPVEITGLKDVPEAGEKFFVAPSTKEAQELGEKRAQLKLTKDRGSSHAMSLEELNNMISKGDIKELPVIIKADVHGSAEALAQALEQIEVGGVKVRVVSKSVGAINESDVLLASANQTIIVGFNVRADANAKKQIESEGIQLIINNIIYKIIEEITDAMEGMREKKYTEDVIGTAEVQEVFKISSIGKVAGALVTSGKITRDSKMRLIREGIVLYDGDIGQLKRYKDDVKEVIEGQDFGVSFKNYSELKKGDELEAYILEEEVFEKRGDK